MLYYRKEMRKTNWEMLSIADMSGTGSGPGYAMMYTSGKDILHIEIFIREKITHVLLRLE